jgi:polyferredoxin
MADIKNLSPSRLSRRFSRFRMFFLIFVLLESIVLRLAGASIALAISQGLILGVIGVVIIFTLSHQKGIMVHCSAYCPLGLVSNITGRISLFRIKINDDCIECMNYLPACRYNALFEDDIKRRKPGYSCTLCGDCVQECESAAIEYNLYGLSANTSRLTFLFIVIVFHACFIALARI